MASEVGNLFILGRYLWIMLSFISLGFQSVLFSLNRLFGIVGAQVFLCEVGNFWRSDTRTHACPKQQRLSICQKKE